MYTHHTSRQILASYIKNSNFGVMNCLIGISTLTEANFKVSRTARTAGLQHQCSKEFGERTDLLIAATAGQCRTGAFIRADRVDI